MWRPQHLCRLGLVLCVWLCGDASRPVLAQAGGDERAQLAAERRALQTRFDTQEQACKSRFAVTACVDELRLRRRDALAPLRARELQLDDAERSQRAQRRQQALQAKQRSTDAATPPEVILRAPAGETSAANAAPCNARTPPSRTKDASRATEAAERAKAAKTRADAARASQAAVAKKLSERAASGKAAAPLPVPAASAPAR